MIDSSSGKSFGKNGLHPVTFAFFPKDFVSYIGELKDGIIPSLSKVPVDPFTNKPYITGVSQDSDIIQVATVLEKFDYSGIDEKYVADSGIPFQKVVGNFEKIENRTKEVGLAGIIPRWALEDFEGFKNTRFYKNGEKIFGADMEQKNNYIFAIDKAPLIQIDGYTNDKTLLFESFENQKIFDAVEYNERISKNSTQCKSKTLSVYISFEYETMYQDGIKSVNCSIDKTTGVNSKSSLYLNWLRKQRGDGTYNYVMIDKNKKYKFSFDIKGNITGNMNFYAFVAKLPNREEIKTGFFNFPLTNEFKKINFYLNSTAPTGNGFSIFFDPTLIEGDYVQFVAHRLNSFNAGDEIWIDNYKLEEIE